MNDKREIFKGDTAWYYARYRKGYPKTFFQFLKKTFHLNKKSRVLDLGTGTGQITIPLSRYVKEVVAVDIEESMLKEGIHSGKKKKIKNIQWKNIKAENISKNLGEFDLVTIGTAFHWMNRKKVLEKIYSLLKNNGAVVIVTDYTKGNSPMYGEQWKKIRKEITQKYIGKRRRAGKGYFKKSSDSFEVWLKKSPFKGYKEWVYQFTRKWKTNELIKFLYSTSFAQKRFFGNKIMQFEKELKKALLKIQPRGIFNDKVNLQVLYSKKSSINKI